MLVTRRKLGKVGGFDIGLSFKFAFSSGLAVEGVNLKVKDIFKVLVRNRNFLSC